MGTMEQMQRSLDIIRERLSEYSPEAYKIIQDATAANANAIRASIELGYFLGVTESQEVRAKIFNLEGLLK